MITLKPYQQKGYEELKEILTTHSTALELSGTGFGKTYVAIAVAKSLGLRVAIVCPKIVIPAWQQVAELAEVEVVFCINYEKVRSKKKPTIAGKWAKGLRTFEWAIPKDTLLIFDEAHKAKTYDSQNCKMLMSAAHYPCKKLFLSATLARDPRELKAPGMCLGLFDSPGYWRWCLGQGVYRGVFGWDYKGTKQELKKLHDVIAPWTHRERTEDIEGFPKNHIEALAVETGNAKKIDKYIKELKKKMEDDEELPIVDMLRERQEIELLKVKVFVEMTEELVDEGKSVVIFTNFTQTMDAIGEHLKMPYARIYGSQDDEERSIGIASFQNNDLKVIIVQVQAGGVGLSLHDLLGRQRVSLISPGWSAIDLIQALGRINRSGALSPAIQKIIFAAGSIEERIRKKVQAKINDIETFNDGTLTY